MLWLVLALAALMPSARAEQMSVQVHGQSEGLGNLTAFTLAQDASGFIWAGTENGLYRFDGARFERIGWSQGVIEVNALVADTAGAVWVGSREGLFRWDNGALRHVTRSGGQALRVVMPQALALADPHRLWVLDEDRQLFEVRSDDGGQNWQVREAIDAAQLAAHRELRGPSSAVAGPDGTLWFGCGDAVCRLEGGQAEVWGRERGLPADHWATLLRASDGALWVRGAQHLMRLPHGAERFVDHSEGLQPSDPVGVLLPLAEDQQGRVLCAGFTELRRREGRGWQRFGADNGLPPGGRLSALLVDREGGVWIARAGAGLFHWSGYGQWENWSTGDGLPHTVVWALTRDGEGRLHAATSGGLAAFNVATRRFSLVPGTAGTLLNSIAADRQGWLWGASIDGQVLQLRSGSDTTAKTVARALPPSSRLIGSRDGSLWLATYLGLYRWSSDSVRTQPERVDPSEKATPWLDICQAPDGALWLAGELGLLHHSADAWEPPAGGAGPASARTVVACARDGSAFSAGPQSGLLHRALRDGHWADADITPGRLRGRKIIALLEDSRGWLWVATDDGVAVWNHRHWRFLEQRNGLIWNDTSQNAFYEDTDGSIWIGTSRGVSHMVAPESLFEPNPATAFVQSVQRDAEPLPTSRFFSLPWSGQSVLEFGLAAPSFRERTALAFEYRLTGYDERWSTSQRPDIRYTGLAPGHYRFEVRLADIERETRSKSAVVEFEIEPPWWGTPIFRLACVLLALASLYGMYRWRMRVFRQREQRLETVVRERTRELEASHEQLRELATRDSLTGAWNRRSVLEILERELLRGRRQRHAVTLVLIDIDHFKRINDVHGHPAGDAVLREFVARLNAAVRSYDAVGRYGGEEFLLVLPGIGSRSAEDRSRLEALHAVIGQTPIPIDAATALPVTCSCGVISVEPGAEASPDALIRAADEALYRAKHAGRNRIDYAPPER